MPWKESTVVEERKAFVEEFLKQEESFSELCRRHGISRQTGYKWVARYEGLGLAGLEDLSRAPGESPQAMSEEVVTALVGLREAHPRWGPRKLRAYLQQHRGEEHWPATSSIGELLKREGLVKARGKRRRTPAYAAPLAHAGAPNQVWCADYKGWFTLGDGQRCDPLTITDAHSRYLLRCQPVAKTDTLRARAVFEAAFREWGMPEAIRTDNGAPFASGGPAGLSRLSMWWIRLGIRPERIEPGRPDQNGRHERMHQTLKQETASPPAANLRQQQRWLQNFQKEYNEERPHEALNYQTPTSVYVPSRRVYPARLPEPEFPQGCTVRSICRRGQMQWAGERVFVSRVLAGELVGLRPIEEDLYEIYYGPVFLGWYDQIENYFVVERKPKKRRRRRREKPAEELGERAAPFRS